MATMDNPADIEAVRGVIDRPLTPDEERTIPQWLGIAWRTLQRDVPGIPARTALDADVPGYLAVDDVKDVVVAMVERKVRNSNGLRTWSGDDYGQTVDNELSAGKIYVTDAEKASLAPGAGLADGGGIYSIPLVSR
jgi:hypothetical protein